MGTKRWELNIQMFINYMDDSITPDGGIYDSGIAQLVRAADC